MRIVNFRRQDAQPPPSPRVGRLTGVGFFGKPLRAVSRFSHQDAQPPPSPRMGRLTGVGFFGKSLRAVSRFSHQDAPTPPSPRVGEGGRGDEGAKALSNSLSHRAVFPVSSKRQTDRTERSDQRCGGKERAVAVIAVNNAADGIRKRNGDAEHRHAKQTLRRCFQPRRRQTLRLDHASCPE